MKVKRGLVLVTLVFVVLTVGCNQKPLPINEEKEEAYRIRIIEDTFKITIFSNEKFPINEKLKFCDTSSDCSVVYVDYCGYSSGGGYGYISKNFSDKWMLEWEKWANRTSRGGCFATLTKINPPQCINNSCQ